MDYVRSVFADDAIWAATSRQWNKGEDECIWSLWTLCSTRRNCWRWASNGKAARCLTWQRKVETKNVLVGGYFWQRRDAVYDEVFKRGSAEREVAGEASSNIGRARDRSAGYGAGLRGPLVGILLETKLRPARLQEEPASLVTKLEWQMRETTVSAESTLYLCSAVAWVRVSYKAYIGDLTRVEMETLEIRIRHVYLEV